MWQMSTKLYYILMNNLMKMVYISLQLLNNEKKAQKNSYEKTLTKTEEDYTKQLKDQGQYTNYVNTVSLYFTEWLVYTLK